MPEPIERYALSGTYQIGTKVIGNSWGQILKLDGQKVVGTIEETEIGSRISTNHNQSFVLGLFNQRGLSMLVIPSILKRIHRTQIKGYFLNRQGNGNEFLGGWETYENDLSNWNLPSNPTLRDIISISTEGISALSLHSHEYLYRRILEVKQEAYFRMNPDTLEEIREELEIQTCKK